MSSLLGILPPAETLAPLLTESNNGFAVLDASGRYAYASASLCNLLSLRKDALLGHALAELVLPVDRAALHALLDEARRAAVEARPCESFAKLRHVCGDAGRWQPVELKARTDGEHLYCVLLDARMPARLESVLPEFLLSTSHDLRTPCCSIQAATALLLALPEVAADGEACSLLHTVNASCEELLRCISNVLQMRQIQRAGPLPLQLSGPRVFDPTVCVNRVVSMVAALGSAHQRLSWTPATMPPLPSRVLGDEQSITACLHNVLLTAMLWLPRDAPVHLHVSTEDLPTRVSSLHVGLSVTAQPPPKPPPVADFTLVITVSAPGRAFTAQEVQSILQPFSMMPADKGGGTGLALYVAQGLARAIDGDLEIQPGLPEGTVLRVRVPLSVPSGDTPPHFELAQAGEPTESPPPFLDEGEAAALAGPCGMGEAREGHTDELQLTSRMFQCLLANSDDVFAHCRIAVLQGEEAVAAAAAGNPGISAYITYISPSVAWRLEFSQADALGRDILSVCHPEDRRSFMGAVQAAYEGSGSTGHRLTYVHRNVTATGGTIWCNTSGLCVGDELFLVCRDMRTIRSVELALRIFTLAVSHDLREPCNAILVATAVLEHHACVSAMEGHEPASPDGEPPNTLNARGLVACVRSACSLLLGILGNVLSAPQVEAGELTLQRDVFCPVRAVQDVVQACRLGCAAAAAAALGGGIELQTGLEAGGEPLPTLVEGDRNRIAQAVQNLVTNACKFGRGAPVLVQASLQHEDEQAIMVVSVADAGCGMTAQEAAECFLSGQAAPASAGGGTGLGLYITKAFAHLMGGTLTVQSELGKGSTFELRAPIRVLSPDEVAAVELAALSMVEAETMAVEAAAEAQRKRVATSEAAVAAVAAAAHGGAQLHAGASAAVRSPVRSPEPRRRLHVLVAEDYQLNLRLITRLLQMHDFEVTAVADGGAALAAMLDSFKQHESAQSPFDAIVLDMVTRKFREWEAEALPHAAKLPIIALTANVLEEHATECSDAGMDMFISKPLRDADVAVLRAHALAHAEQRALEAMEAIEAAETAAHVAVEAAAARASMAHHVLGMPAVAAARLRGSSRSSSPRSSPLSSPRGSPRSSVQDKADEKADE